MVEKDNDAQTAEERKEDMEKTNKAAIGRIQKAARLKVIGGAIEQFNTMQPNEFTREQ
jgi:hypothetical protein